MGSQSTHVIAVLFVSTAQYDITSALVEGIALGRASGCLAHLWGRPNWTGLIEIAFLLSSQLIVSSHQ